MAAGDGRTGATMEEQEFGSVLGKQQMSMCRLIAGLLGLAFVTAAAMAVVSIGTEVRAEFAPVVANESPPKMLRSDGWACAQEPWPYGCQWRAASVKRVIIRTPRPI
jgi:hypothetical protein